MAQLDNSEATPEVWASLLDRMIEQMLSQRALFIFHERNQAAIENLHQERHEADHDDLQMRFRQALSNRELPIEVRVRMACAIGAVMGSIAFAGDVFGDVPSDELGAMLRGAVGNLLELPPS